MCRDSLNGDMSPYRSIVALLFCAVAAHAETFTVRLDSGNDVRVQARLAGSGQKAHALELADGSLQVIPADRLIERTTGPDPTPITFDQMLAQLTDEFGGDRLVTEIEKPFVIVLVRATNNGGDPRHVGVVRKAGSFFKQMQTSFLDFVRQARVETVPVKYPLVALIFESDRQFDAYAVSITGQDGLSPENIAAFYDLMSNRLVIRLRECASFDTPLHEAVHQQVYNRGILQRLAPVPAWFNEGLATGFEGDGERIRGGPKIVSNRYGPLALQARVVNWREVVANDRSFHGDVLASEAYGHAWGLHWLLVTKYRTEYHKLVRHFAAKQPLDLDRPDQRVEEFERILGKSVKDLQDEFYRELPKALRRKK